LGTVAPARSAVAVATLRLEQRRAAMRQRLLVVELRRQRAVLVPRERREAGEAEDEPACQCRASRERSRGKEGKCDGEGEAQRGHDEAPDPLEPFHVLPELEQPQEVPLGTRDVLDV